MNPLATPEAGNRSGLAGLPFSYERIVRNISRASRKISGKADAGWLFSAKEDLLEFAPVGVAGLAEGLDQAAALLNGGLVELELTD